MDNKVLNLYEGAEFLREIRWLVRRSSSAHG